MEAQAKQRGLKLLCPHRMVASVAQVSVAELKAQGIRGVILDLDNTLVLWHGEEMTEDIRDWLAKLQAAGIQMCILSNSILSRRSERIANRLGCHLVRKARKPRRRGFRLAMERMGTSPTETAIVGDQMFTDILGGNRTGIYTIMVKPLAKHEFVYTRYVSRPPEKLLLNLFRKRGYL